jgi:hypothetical protein
MEAHQQEQQKKSRIEVQRTDKTTPLDLRKYERNMGRKTFACMGSIPKD